MNGSHFILIWNILCCIFECSFAENNSKLSMYKMQKVKLKCWFKKWAYVWLTDYDKKNRFSGKDLFDFYVFASRFFCVKLQEYKWLANIFQYQFLQTMCAKPSKNEIAVGRISVYLRNHWGLNLVFALRVQIVV